MESFFLVTPIGFEELACLELNEKFPGLSEVRSVKGGVEFSAPKEICHELNAYLKIPSAILLRIAEFRARDFPKLFNKAKKVDWPKWTKGRKIEVTAAAQKSRLGNEKRIVQTILDAIGAQKQNSKLTPIEIQIRIFEDNCTISIDTSGEALFKRGYKTLSANAPIRENLAAGLVYYLQKMIGPLNVWVDPMCGSGTFLFEAALFNEKNHFRAFPDLSDGSKIQITQEYATDEIMFWIGMDQSKSALENFHSTLGFLKENIQTENKTNWQPEKWKVLNVDFLNEQDVKRALVEVPSRRMAFIVNPPYGERIRYPLAPTAFYQKLVNNMTAVHPCGFGVIVPENKIRYFPKVINGYESKGTLRFKNGGIPVQFLVFGGKNRMS